MNTLFYRLKDIAKAMWFRCLLYCLFAVASFFIGSAFEAYVPVEIKEIVTQEGLNHLLTILASSMLAVTTFSLSIMVQAFSAAATTATPRANKLLMEDSTAQNALGTFIGAFLFSIIGIIGINSSLYGEGIIIVLFMFTVTMIVVIVVMLLRWIDQLSKLGRVTETINLVDNALKDAIKKRGKHPFLDANQLKHSQESLLQTMVPIIAEEVGYVQFIDIEELEKIAIKNDFNIYIVINPGKFIDGVTPFAFIDKHCKEDLKKCICKSILTGRNRTFEQDPRYGFIVLSEIAIRALSPAINDPGTAIDIVASYIRGISLWAKIQKKYQVISNQAQNEIRYPHIYINKIEESDFFEDMYAGLIPSAAEHIIVAIRLKKSLISFKSIDNVLLSKHAEYWLQHLELLCQEKLNVNDFEKIKAIS